MTHANTYNKFYPLQRGFRKLRSCETQIITFINDVSKNLKYGKYTDLLRMDFSKAFDKVSHCLLLCNLCNYKIEGKVNCRLESFF